MDTFSLLSLEAPKTVTQDQWRRSQRAKQPARRRFCFLSRIPSAVRYVFFICFCLFSGFGGFVAGDFFSSVLLPPRTHIWLFAIRSVISDRTCLIAAHARDHPMSEAGALHKKTKIFGVAARGQMDTFAFRSWFASSWLKKPSFTNSKDGVAQFVHTLIKYLGSNHIPNLTKNSTLAKSGCEQASLLAKAGNADFGADFERKSFQNSNRSIPSKKKCP